MRDLAVVVDEAVAGGHLVRGLLEQVAEAEPDRSRVEQLASSSCHIGSSSGLIGRRMTGVPSCSVRCADVLLGIRADGQVGVGPTARPAARSRSTTTRASSAMTSLGRDQQRVDVQLLDLGVVGHEVGEPHEDLDQPVDVRRRACRGSPAAAARTRSDSSIRRASGSFKRRQAQRPVAEHLGRHAAHAHHDHRRRRPGPSSCP